MPCLLHAIVLSLIDRYSYGKNYIYIYILFVWCHQIVIYKDLTHALFLPTQSKDQQSDDHQQL